MQFVETQKSMEIGKTDAEECSLVAISLKKKMKQKHQQLWQISIHVSEARLTSDWTTSDSRAETDNPIPNGRTSENWTICSSKFKKLFQDSLLTKTLC